MSKLRGLKQKEEVLAFLDSVMDGSFGMVLFHAVGEDGEQELAAHHLFHCKDEDVVGMQAIQASHTLWTVAEHYTVDEIADFLLEDNVLTFATETKGSA